MQERRRAHGRDAAEPLTECAAVILDPSRLEPRSFPTVLTLTIFVAAAYLFWHEVVRRTPSGWAEVGCCLPVTGLLAIWLGWTCYLRIVEPRHRGRLRLKRDELTFEWKLGAKKVLRIPLGDIGRLGRFRNRIHVVRASNKGSYFFACSRLHGEDVFDQLRARLDDLGMEVVVHESKGKLR